ncbi:hypothetical protein F0562_032998 [Nyssa sinensis]|uniref:Protein kinase domain-containing protein n=1 Tax=Nyssa sinensis TaxID=561372 RepID=A0A5J5AP41_9ASTE|nr:hypothetical protein F0562_032998 [Nyssa sinensis]
MNTTDKHPLLFLILTSLYLTVSIAATANSSYTPLENIALNCGDQGDSTAQDGRKWTGDTSSQFIPSQPPPPPNASSTSTASTQDFAPQIPYMTARLFHSQFTYVFPLSPGPKFIRLHFHPASYSGLNISNSFFDVTANNHYTLLHNFSALLTSRFPKKFYFVKEFCIYIASEQQLDIAFVPSPGSFGFINGIEVLSMPSDLYIKAAKKSPSWVNPQQLEIDNNTALENVYRLNVAGQAISPVDDNGMFRAWSNDMSYIYGGPGVEPGPFTIKMKYSEVPPYTAPEVLYRTARSMGTNSAINENYNLTWFFPVDRGFYYLVRLHFCEIEVDVTGINQRVFEIFLNNQTADDQMDIIVYAGGNGVPIYRDFVVMVPLGSGGKQDLWLALHPNTKSHPMYYDALLNGLEIFKLNKSDGNLAGPNPDPIDDPNSNQFGPSSKKINHPNKSRIFVIVAVVLSGAIGLSILTLFIFCQRRGYYLRSSYGSWCSSPELDSTTRSSLVPSHICHHFSLAEIKSATNDFSEALLIGVGGFGNVYKGYINNGDTPVAIKRLNPKSQQGAHEFFTEIELLSQLRHVHLVSLIGYCEVYGEMILVYDYMSRGTLRDHLYNTDNPPLLWKQRLRICIGAARGLHYLHTGVKHMIIHRDVKTTNILLDEKWVAKVSDFGLSRLGPTSVSHTHVSTEVKGSFGYLDPEYFWHKQLTEKSDVYSFGVVLFEVVCARPPVDKKLEKSAICLSEWARSHYRNGTLDQIIDPNLKGQIAPECLRKIGEIADSCLLDEGIKRPAMADVLWNLEFALQLQESAEESGAYKELDVDRAVLYTAYVGVGPNKVETSSSSGVDSGADMSGSIFTEIKNPKAQFGILGKITISSSSTAMNTTDKHPLLFLILTSLYLTVSIAATANSSYTPLENIALNCGDQGDSTAQDGRKWTGDTSSQFIPSQPPPPPNASSTSTASTQDFAPQIPYMTARLFHSQFTYVFPLSPGPKFIRLHFQPASYSGLNISNSFFDVTANNHYTLLHNFSALLTSRSYFVKEFCIYIASEQRLDIAFVPSPGSFGFINGIEVLSMPSDLYIKGQEIPIVGQSQTLEIDNNTALENVYRLNVDGQAISPVEDNGMFRAWSDDSSYIFGAPGVDPSHFTIKMKYSKVPPYTAPEVLYRTARSMGMNSAINENYNLTWLFPVDRGFYYLVRLHFCEIDVGVTGINQRVFEIFLNNQTADDQMDIIVYAGGNGVPIYRDFVVMVPLGSGGKQDLWLALHPNTKSHPMYYDALLNGLEIFKLNKSDGNLAGPYPDPIDDPNSNQFGPSSKKINHPNKSRIFVIVAVVLSGAIGLSILTLFIFCQRRGYYLRSSYGSWCSSPELDLTTRSSLVPSHICHHFSLAEIKSATNDFSEALLIGVGGFGNVYKGYINNGDTPVAIKRLNPKSQQGAHEFFTEIELLSQLRHVHLVSLIGYCEVYGEMILVYDYMSRGTLRDHLYNTDNPPLLWKQRLRICIGVARGLHYLHTGVKHMIIHRDVKTTNILLDEKWVAKVSDFGLSRLGPTSESHTHVSTEVKGSFGYLDPEYFRLKQLTEKSDVYAFGVVLFEVVCARPPVDKKLEKSAICLSEWARSHYRSGTLDQIIDPNLKGQIAPECLRKIGEIADSCLLDEGIRRPAMADVLWNLEFALQLQESAEESGAYKELDVDRAVLYTAYVGVGPNKVETSSSSGVDSGADMSGSIFTEIKNPVGR